MQRLSGIGVSGGAGVGRAAGAHSAARRCSGFRIAASRLAARDRPAGARPPALGRAAGSHSRLRAARPRSARTLFEAQRLMVDDPMLLPRAASIIGEQRINAEWALQQVFDHLGAVFDGVEDPYLRERKGDLADVVGRLRMNLTPGGAGFRDILGVCEGPLRPGCRRVAAVNRGAARLDQVRGVHHRRGQPHLSHRDSREIAPRARDRRAARCHRAYRALAR